MDSFATSRLFQPAILATSEMTCENWGYEQ